MNAVVPSKGLCGYCKPGELHHSDVRFLTETHNFATSQQNSDKGAFCGVRAMHLQDRKYVLSA